MGSSLLHSTYILSICWVPVTLPGCVRYRADLNKIHGHSSLSHMEDSLDPCSSKCCPQTSTSDIAWEIFRNAESQAPTQNYWIWMGIFTGEVGILNDCRCPADLRGKTDQCRRDQDNFTAQVYWEKYEPTLNSYPTWRMCTATLGVNFRQHHCQPGCHYYPFYVCQTWYSP